MREFYPLETVDTVWYEQECLRAVRKAFAFQPTMDRYAFFGLRVVSVERVGERPDTCFVIRVETTRRGERVLRFPVWTDPPLGQTVTTAVPDASLFASNVVDYVLEDA